MARGTTYNSANGFPGIGKESTAGTPVTPTVFCPVNSFEGHARQEIPTFPTIRSISGFGPQTPNLVKTWGEGRVAGPLTYDNFGIFWEAALGAASSSGAGPYQHTYTTDSSVLDSYTIEVHPSGDMTNEMTLAGAKCDSLTITFPRNDYATIEGSFVAMTATDYTTGTARTAPTNQRPVISSDLTVTIGGTDHSDAIEDVRVVINNALNRVYTIGSDSPRAIEHVHTRTMQIEITIQVTSGYFEALVDDWRAVTSRTIVMTATNGSEQIAATATNCYLSEEPSVVTSADKGPLTTRLVYAVIPDETPTQVTSVVIDNDDSSAIGNG